MHVGCAPSVHQVLPRIRVFGLYAPYTGTEHFDDAIGLVASSVLRKAAVIAFSADRFCEELELFLMETANVLCHTQIFVYFQNYL